MVENAAVTAAARKAELTVDLISIWSTPVVGFKRAVLERALVSSTTTGGALHPAHDTSL
jgi:hypothetical protein